MTGKSADRKDRRSAEEYRAYLAEIAADFQEAYREAKGKGGFVRARNLFCTGLILSELERAKIIERQGDSFRPEGRHR